MVSSNEVINLIKGFSLTERLMIVEEILKNIREESASNKAIKSRTEVLSSESSILSLAGIFDEEEAKVFNSAVEESRKIDNDGW